jgi:hypothetical protein
MGSVEGDDRLKVDERAYVMTLPAPPELTILSDSRGTASIASS